MWQTKIQVDPILFIMVAASRRLRVQSQTRLSRRGFVIHRCHFGLAVLFKCLLPGMDVGSSSFFNFAVSRPPRLVMSDNALFAWLSGGWYKLGYRCGKERSCMAVESRPLKCIVTDSYYVTRATFIHLPLVAYVTVFSSIATKWAWMLWLA